MLYERISEQILRIGQVTLWCLIQLVLYDNDKNNIPFSFNNILPKRE